MEPMTMQFVEAGPAVRQVVESTAAAAVRRNKGCGHDGPLFVCVAHPWKLRCQACSGRHLQHHTLAHDATCGACAAGGVFTQRLVIGAGVGAVHMRLCDPCRGDDGVG
jgi:hypothetical protein